MGLHSYIRTKLRGNDKKIGNTVVGASKCFKSSRASEINNQVVLEDVLTRMRMSPPLGMTGFTGRDYYLKFMLPIKSLLSGSQTSVVVTVTDRSDLVPHRKRVEQKKRDLARTKSQEIKEEPEEKPYPDTAQFKDEGIWWTCTDGTIHTELFNINRVLSGRRSVRSALFNYIIKTFE
jgi:hypothetical protein